MGGPPGRRTPCRWRRPSVRCRTFRGSWHQGGYRQKLVPMHLRRAHVRASFDRAGWATIDGACVAAILAVQRTAFAQVGCYTDGDPSCMRFVVARTSRRLRIRMIARACTPQQHLEKEDVRRVSGGPKRQSLGAPSERICSGHTGPNLLRVSRKSAHQVRPHPAALGRARPNSSDFGTARADRRRAHERHLSGTRPDSYLAQRSILQFCRVMGVLQWGLS